MCMKVYVIDTHITSKLTSVKFTSTSYIVLHSRQRVVRLMSTLRAGRFGVQIPVWTGAFVFSKTSRRALRTPSLPFNGYWGSTTGIRRLGYDVKRSPSSRAEVKNGWSYTSTSLIWYDIWYIILYDTIWYDIFVNCNWVDTRWQ